MKKLIGTLLLVPVLFAMFFFGPAPDSMNPARQRKSLPTPPVRTSTTFTCKMAIVEWHDAVVYTKQVNKTFQTDELTASVLSIGCIQETEKTILIVHSFTEGSPDDFLAIPRDWVTLLTPLMKKEEK